MNVFPVCPLIGLRTDFRKKTIMQQLKFGIHENQGALWETMGRILEVQMNPSKFELLWGHMAKNYSHIQQCHALCLLSVKVYNVDTPGQVSPYIPGADPDRCNRCKCIGQSHMIDNLEVCNLATSRLRYRSHGRQLDPLSKRIKCPPDSYGKSHYYSNPLFKMCDARLDKGNKS